MLIAQPCCNVALDPAELLDILRNCVETRKTQLVDAALDLIQKLLSHGLLSGPVQSINHRREAASKAAGTRKKVDGDDDEADPTAQGPMPVQVCEQGSQDLYICHSCICCHLTGQFKGGSTYVTNNPETSWSVPAGIQLLQFAG